MNSLPHQHYTAGMLGMSMSPGRGMSMNRVMNHGPDLLELQETRLALQQSEQHVAQLNGQLIATQQRAGADRSAAESTHALLQQQAELVRAAVNRASAQEEQLCAAVDRGRVLEEELRNRSQELVTMENELKALKWLGNAVAGMKLSHQGVALRLHQSLEALQLVRHAVRSTPLADGAAGGLGADVQPGGLDDRKLIDALQKLRTAEQQFEVQRAHALSLQAELDELRALHSKSSALGPQAGLHQHILEIHRGQQLHLQSLSDMQEENRGLHHELVALRRSQQKLWVTQQRRDSSLVMQTWSIGSVPPDVFWRHESCETAERSVQTDGSTESRTALAELELKCSGKLAGS